MKYTSATLILTIVAGAMLTQAQNPSPPPVFKSKTDLVLVPVIVRDRHNEHVPGLTASDFTVEDNGVPEALVSVEEISSNTTLPQPIAPKDGVFTNQFVDQQPNAVVIVVLDLVNTPALEMAGARKAVLKFLATRIKQNQVLGLVTIEPGRVRLLHAFTSSAVVLSEALQRVTGISSTTSELPTNGDAGRLNSAHEREVGTAAAGLTAMMVQAQREIQEAMASTNATRREQGIKSTLESLRIISSWVAGIPGRKALLWVTGSVPFVVQSSTSNLEAEDYNRSMKALSDANIAVYPVDARGLFNADFDAQSGVYMGSGPYAEQQGRASISSVPAPQDPAYSHFAMNDFAQATGGLALYNRNDIEKMLDTAASDSAKYYMLSYYLRPRKPGWHKLKVSVKRRGVTTRARSGFLVVTLQPETDAVRQVEENTALLSPFDYTALPLSLKWTSSTLQEGKRKVHFEISIPASAGLVDDGDRNVLDLDFIAVATAVTGETAGLTSRNVHSNPKPAAMQQIEANGVTYVSDLDLNPGEYAIRVVVRDNITGRLGAVTAPLRVE